MNNTSTAKRNSRSGTLALGSSRVALILGVLLSSQVSWAALSACATVDTQSNTLASYGATSLTNGCYSVDQNFSNFSVTTASATSTNNGTGNTPDVPTTSNIIIYATGTGPSGNNIGPVDVTFAPVTSSNQNWVLNGNGLQTQAGTINFVTYTGAGGVYPTPTAPNTGWAITSANFTPGVLVNTNITGNAINLTQIFCLSSTTTSGCLAADQATITATYAAGVTTPTYSCVAGTNIACSSTNSITFSAVYTVASSISFELTRANVNGAQTNIVQLGTLGSSFAGTAVTPEPATLSMMGVALAALAYRARRKKLL